MLAPSTRPIATPDRSSQRLFFALWPSAADAERIMAWVHQAHKAVGGRTMRVDTLHLTLAFLGSTPFDRVQALVQAAPLWSAPVGPVTLRRFGRFAGPRVVWAGPGEEDSLSWLSHLHDDLWCRLQALGWQRPDSPFRPHVSLLRKAGPGDLAALHRPSLAWMPEQCVLVASQPTESGSTYQALARMPLQGLS
ncbi:RNA 2',3'-cyclic phosphodiesterase [Pollutimonas harenae]|uniref:RNA 2',3'-cyclic phosphodiesterase n=1 Tax=Pollutimonas harenae TaxID=657015 RepID=A0A853GQL5_9BURK|nr:RNA 2',3'-cyclic phosphodiesterase [Pollutimonas harenae]NYT84457.1 RNA 2',3'-cyclic phosphodiesterase [Pollutimonas harenae]TEA73144.1 RNA 2',3'-cyclic phosphodiesterase [Pollutimonas harenae]